MKARAIDIFKFLIGWPLSILALFFIVRLIIPQISQVQNALTSLNPFLLILSVLFFIGYYIARTYLWHAMLAEKGSDMTLKETMHLWSLSEINRYIPGNIWSFISRTARFGEKKLTKKDIATSLLHETFFVLLASLIVSLLSIPYLMKIPYTREIFHVVQPEIFPFIILGLTTLFVFQKKILRFVFPKVADRRVIIQERPAVTLKFLGISTVGMLSFGIGYFFAIASVVSIPAHDFFTLSGFAVVSLLIGFLSFVTPTGLGVREGFLTLGLTPLMDVSLAGFAALFARIVLIVGEILFLSLTSFLSQTKNIYVQKAEKYISSHLSETFLTLSVIAYTVYFSVASFLRYDNFYTGRFDLGNMVQTVWNSSQGKIFLFTHPDSVEPISRLAFHADVILLLFAPFYPLWPHPDFLLFIQALIVAIGAFFVFGIAKHLLKHNGVSFIIAISYLLNPALERANLYDFHAVVLATTFFLGAWYFFLKKRYIFLAVFLILAGITKEQVWAITALFGLMVIFQTVWDQRKKKSHMKFLFLSERFLFGLSFFVISLLLFYLLIWHLIPQAKGGQHFAIEFYGEFGSSPSDIITSMFLHPIQTFQVMFEADRLDYLRQLFLPLGFLPLLFPFTLIFAIPDLLINLLSANANLHQIYYQYTATITPFLFISLIYAIYILHKYVPKLSYVVLGIYIFVMSLYGAYLYGPLPGSKRPNLAMFDTKTQNREEIAAFLDQIPKDFKVAATNNAGSHLSERDHIYTIPVGLDEADVIVFLIDPHPNRDLDMKERILRYINNPNYILVKKLDNFYVFQKNSYLTYF